MSHPAHALQLNPTITRRLIGIEDVALKMGEHRNTFNRKRKEYEREGFPPPLFGGNKGGTLRWDERAIDLWLDARMPPSLLDATERKRLHREATSAYDATQLLTRRADTLNL